MQRDRQGVLYTYRLERYAGESEPDRVQVTREVNCWIVWDESLDRFEEGAPHRWRYGFVGLFLDRDVAIEYAISYGPGRLASLTAQYLADIRGEREEQ